MLQLTICNQNQAEAALKTISSHLKRTCLLKQDYDAEVQQLTARYRDNAQPWEDEIQVRIDALVTYARENRSIWDDYGEKTAYFISGEIGWRKTTLSVQVLNEDKACEVLGRFTHYAKVLDKNGLKRTYKNGNEDKTDIQQAIADGLIEFTEGETLFIKVGERSWKQPA